MSGAVKTLNVAIAKNEAGDYVYTGTDAINLDSEADDLVVTDVDYDSLKDVFVEYYTDSNGDAVVIGLYSTEDDATSLTSFAKGSYAIGSDNANSKTVMNIVRYSADETPVYTASTVTGYKNFPAIASGVAYFDTDKNVVYVYAADEAQSTETSYAFCVEAGEKDVNGYVFNFVLSDGSTAVYYSNASDTVEAGFFYTGLTVNGKNVITDAGEKVEDSARAKLTVKSLDAAYFVDNSDAVHEYAANTVIVDLTGNGATALAEDMDVIVFVTKTDSDENPTNITIFIVDDDVELGTYTKK
jgi:hypothetical protein